MARILADQAAVATSMVSPHLFGAAGYGIAGLLFFFLGILLLTRWRARVPGKLLVVAAFGSSLWGAGLAAEAAWHCLPMHLVRSLEALRALVWVLFLLAVLQVQLGPRGGRTLLFSALRALAVMLAFMLALPIEERKAELSSIIGPYIPTLQLALQITLSAGALVLVEQVYRNTPTEGRWAIKFLCLGIGAAFAYDFYLFADVLLFQRPDLSIWLGRGAANALVVPLIVLSVTRHPQWSFGILMSRKVAFHATAIVAAVLYLSVMSFAGHYIRFYGGEWSTVLQAVFFFGAALLLVILFFSVDLRSRAKVLINKHFFSYKYDYREEWLQLIRILSGDVLQATLAERIIYALGGLVDSPGGALWLCRGRASCEYHCSRNLTDSQLDKRDDLVSVARYFSARRWIVNLDEYDTHPDVYDRLVLPTWLANSGCIWLIVPLFHDDDLLGMVLLARSRTPQQLNWETLDLLKTAAQQAASYLALEQAARALAEARQFEGFNRLSAFIVHDLKNVVAQLSLVARNAERHKCNPAFMEDAIATVRNSVDKMGQLLAQLRGSVPENRLDKVDLHEVVREAVAARAGYLPRPQVVVEDTASAEVYADRQRLAAVIGHIIQNAQEATRSSGKVTVRLTQEDHQGAIEIADDGVGMDAAFVRDRLFKPFDSTKGLTGMGIGAYECREFIRALGGRVDVVSHPGEGTTFTMILPSVEETREPRSLVTDSG